MHRSVGLIIVTLGLFVPHAAHAADDLADKDPSAIDYEPPLERRGGFVMGITGGPAFGSYSGFPNEVGAIGNPDDRAATGFSFGSSARLWFGGALRDWLTVGLGFKTAGANGNDLTGGSFATLFRVETFPLYWKGGAFRDLGVSADFGLSGAVIQNDDGDNVADGGTMSHVGLEVFYEPFRFWNFSTGPAASYAHDFSQSLKVHQMMLGWRFVFYGVQPESG